MKHLNRCVSCFSSGFDLLGVLVAVSNLKGQGVVPNVAFDVHAEINFHAIALFQHHVAVPALDTLDLMVGGKVCSQIVHGDGAWKRWFPTVAVNESLGGLNDFVEGLPGLKFIFHGFEGATGYVPCIPPILQVGFFHH